MPAASEVLPSSADTGTLGLYHLKRYWAKVMAMKSGDLPGNSLPEEWETDNHLLNTLRLGLEETLKYLYMEAPSFGAFENWIAARQQQAVLTERIRLFNRFFSSQQDEQITLPVTADVLSDGEMAHWYSEGYVIVTQAIPPQDCEAAVEAICQLLSVNPGDPRTWYMPHPAREGIMVQLFDHPVIERNRHSPRIRKAYEQIWKRTDLQVNADKVGFNPPETVRWKFPASGLHWDVSLKQPIPFGTQGILYLSDTTAAQGAFTVVPGFHLCIAEWLDSLPANADPRCEDLYKLGAVPVPAMAGDLIIWHHCLPHAASANRAGNPRFVQYLNYAPAKTDKQPGWI